MRERCKRHYEANRQIPSSRKGWEFALVVVVGRFCRFPDLVLCLIEQIFCLRRMATHIPLVGLLRCSDAVVCTVDQVLRRHKVGVTGSLRDEHAACKTSQAQNRAQKEFASCHRENLRKPPYRPRGSDGNKKIMKIPAEAGVDFALYRT